MLWKFEGLSPPAKQVSIDTFILEFGKLP